MAAGKVCLGSGTAKGEALRSRAWGWVAKEGLDSRRERLGVPASSSECISSSKSVEAANQWNITVSLSSVRGKGQI